MQLVTDQIRNFLQYIAVQFIEFPAEAQLKVTELGPKRLRSGGPDAGGHCVSRHASSCVTTMMRSESILQPNMCVALCKCVRSPACAQVG